MKYKLLFVFLIAALPIVSAAQQPGYLNWLRQYWNYRYHLMGDGTIKTQHFPTDCNFPRCSKCAFRPTWNLE
jgi:hypothetical protein